MFTATMHNYWLRCVCELLKVKQATALVKVASALEVLEGDSGYINMGGAVVHSESELHHAFRMQLDLKSREMPVIIFLTGQTPATLAIID